ncbi:MAG: phage baseplate protein, partial [Armatimonadota bacterium]
LPEEIVTELAARMAEAQPEAEVLLDLECAACGHRWQAPLDIAAFLWTEIASRAKRLLREVHTLAQVYGWRESDVLALSDARRQHYLGLVTG